jgi:hypothetical protein
MKWRFAGKFLLSFAVLVTLWWAVDFAQLYRSAVLSTVQVLSPAVDGWWLDYDRPGVPNPVFRSGGRDLAMLLQLPALSMGLMPFLALVVATPGLGLKRMAITLAVGSALYFLIHIAVVLSYPLIMDQPNVFKDTLGVFSGLVAFVLAPLGLWFVLTYPALRSLWQLMPAQASAKAEAKVLRPAGRRTKRTRLHRSSKS